MMKKKPRKADKTTSRDAPDNGIVCRHCECRHFYVQYTWHLSDGRIRRRRR